MKEWNLNKKIDDNYPHVLLQKYADGLTTQTDGTLSGHVTETIYNDSFGLPHISYSLHICLARIKQSYRLFEVEQLRETVYPVKLKIFFYTGAEEFNGLQNVKELETKLDELVSSPGVSMLINHFLNLSNLKDEDEDLRSIKNKLSDDLPNKEKLGEL